MAAGGGLKPPAAIREIGAKMASMGKMEPWASGDVSANGIKIHYYRTGGEVAYIDHAGHNIRRDQFERYMSSVTAFLAAILSQ